MTNDARRPHPIAGEAWRKIHRALGTAGFEVVRKALELYYLLEDPMVPAPAKATVVGALAYFIAPLDLVPDLVPLTGYADDLTMLGAALTAVAAHVTPAVKRRAEATARRLFT